MDSGSRKVNAGVRVQWQLQLEEYCIAIKIAKPQYSTFSDRRGGRTAWSCTVTVQSQTFAARYWYDGDYVENAMEDAAERALKTLNGQANTAFSAEGNIELRR